MRSLIAQLAVALVAVGIPTRAGAQPAPVTKTEVLPKPKKSWVLPYNSWRLYGPLRESRTILRAFFGTKAIKEKGVLEDSDRKKIQKEAKDLGYHLISILPKQLADKSTEAMVKLQPITYIRRVAIDVDAGNVGLLAQLLDRVFSSAVRRRMRIRPGYKLKLERYQRDQVLIQERDRIEDYLREEEGYYDVIVKVRTESDGKWAARLVVNIFLGARYKVGNVKIVGNAAIRAPKIRKMFFHKRACIPLLIIRPYCFADQRFSKRQLKRDIEAVAVMYRRRGFPAVRVYHDYSVKSYNPTKKQVDFTVYINERRRILPKFEGNKSLPARALQKQLTFAKEGSYDTVEVTASAEALRRYYQSRGFFEATVTTERVPFKGEKFESIVFTIDEGPKLFVKQVTFSGNKTLAASRLKKRVRTIVYSARTPFTKNLFPTSSQLSGDVNRIRNLYTNQGFPEVKVTVHVTRADHLEGSIAALAAMVAAGQPTRGLIVSYRVTEGARQLIDRVRVVFRGKHTIRSRRLHREIKLKRGAPLLKHRIKKEIRRLKTFYFKAGFPNVKISAKTAKGTRPNRSIVVFVVDETQQMTFGEVIVRGNFRTKTWVIKSELGYKPNSLVRREIVDRGQRNLLRANLFNGVSIDLRHQQDTTEGKLNVLVHVQERHDRTLDAQLGAGYSTDSKEFVEAALIAPNIWGWGIRADAKGFYGAEFKSGEIKLTIPRWVTRRHMWTPFEIALGGFARKELTERFGELVSLGGSAELTKTSERDAFKGWRLSLRYDWRFRNREEQLVRPAGSRDGIETDVVNTTTGAIGPRLAIERRQDSEGRENVMDPQKGYRIELRALFASRLLGGDDEFLKIGFSAQYFTGFGTKRFTLMNGVRYDHGFPLRGAVLLPEVERYFAGGDTTIRGFEEDRLATEIIRADVPPFTDLNGIRILPAGGNLRFLYNIDLQVKLFKLGPLPVASGVFIDTGLVANSLDGLKLSDLRHSIGTALRLSSPFFRFSLEWAIPLDPELGDNPLGRFHITIGALF